jgi:leucyl aminopeptidase
MSEIKNNAVSIEFKPISLPDQGDLVVFVDDELKTSEQVARDLGQNALDLIARAAAAERFKGKAQSALTIVAPHGLKAERLIVVGIGGEKDRAKLDFVTLGGSVAGKIGKHNTVI